MSEDNREGDGITTNSLPGHRRVRSAELGLSGDSPAPSAGGSASALPPQLTPQSTHTTSFHSPRMSIRMSIERDNNAPAMCRLADRTCSCTLVSDACRPDASILFCATFHMGFSHGRYSVKCKSRHQTPDLRASLAASLAGQRLPARVSAPWRIRGRHHGLSIARQQGAWDGANSPARRILILCFLFNPNAQ
jgi:hypothetical protein